MGDVLHDMVVRGELAEELVDEVVKDMFDEDYGTATRSGGRVE